MTEEILLLHPVHFFKNSALFRQLKQKSAVVVETRELTSKEETVTVPVDVKQQRRMVYVPSN
jgi:hypothetical protein